MSPVDVGNLTYAEYRQMTKTYYENLKFSKKLERDAVFNAIHNAFRNKNEPFVEMFEDAPEEKTEAEILEERRELFG